MRRSIGTLIATVVAVGCTTNPADEREPETGVAELRIDTSAITGPITRVTVESDGVSQNLTVNPNTGTFDGTLFLPSGTHSLVASAFARPNIFVERLVAQSRPTPVDIQPAAITRIRIAILEIDTQGPQGFGPIIDSLAFPTTAVGGQSVTFAVTAVAPLGAFVGYTWTSSCADSTFSAPSDTTTSWSKPTEGACTITIAVDSGGFTVRQSFSIVVFPPGTGSGAATVSGGIVTFPQAFFSMFEVGCGVSRGSNGSCSKPIASPNASSYTLNVFDWGGSEPGTLTLSDNCGGTFGTSQRSPDNVSGFWLPPVNAGVCLITANAVSTDDLTTTLVAAILVRAGTAATAQPPLIGVSLDGGCFLTAGSASGNASTDCGPIQAGATRNLFGSTGYPDGHPGSITLTDDCAGPLPQPTSTVFNASWTAPSTPQACTLTVHATTIEGSSTDAAMHYQVVAPPLPPRT